MYKQKKLNGEGKNQNVCGCMHFIKIECVYVMVTIYVSVHMCCLRCFSCLYVYTLCGCLMVEVKLGSGHLVGMYMQECKYKYDGVYWDVCVSLTVPLCRNTFTVC